MFKRILISLLLLVLYSMPCAAGTPLQAQLDALVREHALDGAALVVVRDGRGLDTFTSGNYTGETVVPIASASKWLSTLVLARLVERDLLHWQDTVGRWLPDAPSATHGITVAQLISHTSGIHHRAGGNCSLKAAQRLVDCVQAILAEPLAATPGTRFDYGGASMQVAARIAERAGGADFASLFAREVSLPLGLRQTEFASLWRGWPGPVGNPSFGAGLRSNASDLGKVMAMFSAGGMTADGRRYLSASTIRQMARDQVRDATVGRSPGIGFSQGYGLGQWLQAMDAQGFGQRVSSPGAFGTTPWLDRQTDLAAVLVVKGEFRVLKDEVVALQRAVEKAYAPR